MITHDLTPNTPEWLAYRTGMFNASDAPAMMNESPYKTRDQLLAEAHSGIAREVTPQQQHIFNEGHRFEALARPLAEEIIADDLYLRIAKRRQHAVITNILPTGADWRPF